MLTPHTTLSSPASFPALTVDGSGLNRAVEPSERRVEQLNVSDWWVSVRRQLHKRSRFLPHGEENIFWCLSLKWVGCSSGANLMVWEGPLQCKCQNAIEHWASKQHPKMGFWMCIIGYYQWACCNLSVSLWCRCVNASVNQYRFVVSSTEIYYNKAETCTQRNGFFSGRTRCVLFTVPLGRTSGDRKWGKVHCLLSK